MFKYLDLISFILSSKEGQLKALQNKVNVFKGETHYA